MDPSPDNTYGVIKKEITRNPNIKLLYMSRRFGQPAATLAGIFNCTGDICVVIDVDLQDSPEIIPSMISKWKDGYNVAILKEVKGETVLKKMVSF